MRKENSKWWFEFLWVVRLCVQQRPMCAKCCIFYVNLSHKNNANWMKIEKKATLSVLFCSYNIQENREEKEYYTNICTKTHQSHRLIQQQRYNIVSPTVKKIRFIRLYIYYCTHSHLLHIFKPKKNEINKRKWKQQQQQKHEKKEKKKKHQFTQ